ncbi:MAG: M20 family metallopeptidase, partial [Oscillospiraceae bacterium]
MVSMQEIQHLKFELSENYKYLHRHPELGFEEHNTSRFILEKLTEYGIECRNVAQTGVVATIRGTRSGKTVGIRADIDALPLTEMADVEYKSENEGVMHACGHDSHVAMLLGAAKYFQDNKDKIKGNVRLIFQPAEEGAAPQTLKAAVEGGCSEKGGAASMIAFGALEGVDACFALHIFPGIPNGKLLVHHDKSMASSDMFEVVICGKGGHGSSPETAIDPVGALSEVIGAFNQFTAREISALEPCVLSIGTINTDSSWNIIPDKVVVTGGFRAFDNKIRDYAFSRLSEIATHI